MTKLLSICLPTYNRAQSIRAQVDFLCAFIEDYDLSKEIEIVVANNCSDDNTVETLSDLNYEYLNIHTHTTHYNTAEENIFRSISLCEGDYVWFLGDDDPVQYANLIYALDTMRNGDVNGIIFNSRSIDSSGSLITDQPIIMNSEYVDMPIASIIESIGILYTLAGISNIFIKRSLLSVESGLSWLSIAPIYSHVAWFSEALQTSQVRIVNASIVSYRQNEYGNHWETMAAKLSVASRSFWSTSLVIILEKLIEQKILTHINIGNAIETTADGRRYRLIDDILYNVFRQMKIYSEKFISREMLSNIEFNNLVSFLIKCDPTLFDLVSILRILHTQLLSAESPVVAQQAFELSEALFETAFARRQTAKPYQWRHITTLNGFEVYLTNLGFLGIEEGIGNKKAYLDTLDVIPDGTNIVAAQTRTEMATLTRAARLNLLKSSNRSNAPPILTSGRKDSGSENEQLARALDTIDALKSSTSWKITAPLRALVTALKGRKD